MLLLVRPEPGGRASEVQHIDQYRLREYTFAPTDEEHLSRGFGAAVTAATIKENRRECLSLRVLHTRCMALHRSCRNSTRFGTHTPGSRGGILMDCPEEPLRNDEERRREERPELSAGKSDEDPTTTSSYRCTHHPVLWLLRPLREGWKTASIPKKGRESAPVDTRRCSWSREPCSVRYRLLKM